MRQILDEYGKTIITTVVVLIIFGIISVVTFRGVVGLIDIAGRNTNDLADNDTIITKSTPTNLLDSQVATVVPELQVAFHPVDHETLSVDRLIKKNNNAGNVDIQPTMITTVLNDNSSDAEKQGLASISGKNITFTNPTTLFLTVDVRQDNRLMTQTFKIIVDKRPEPIYAFAQVNGSWCYCKNEFDTNTRDMTKHTVIKKYPFSKSDNRNYQFGDPILFMDSNNYSYDSVNNRIVKETSTMIFSMTYSGNSGSGTLISNTSSTSYIPVSAINQETGMP